MIGKGSYAYWGHGTTYKGGDPSSDEHLPFNPSLQLELPMITYDQQKETTADKLIPNIIYDKELVPGTVGIETRFRDPILLSEIFTYKGLPTAWQGDGTDVMTFNHSALTNWDKNLWMQCHINDASGSGNHLNVLYDGGQPLSYEWNGGAGKPVIERMDIEFTELTSNTQAVDIDDGLDDGSFDDTGIDGGWSNWDGGYDASKGEVALSKDCTITLGGSAVSGIDIQDWKFVIATPRSNYWVASSLTAHNMYLMPFSWYAELTGKSSGNNALTEFLAAIGSKTKATFKIQYGTTKYLQFTNAYYKEADPLSSFGPAGEAVETTYRIEPAANSVLTYYWNATETTDPSDYINHTNV